MDILKIANRVSGKCVSHLEARSNERLTIGFTDGSSLQVENVRGGFRLHLVSANGSNECPAAVEPTSRQHEYLEFIRKYMSRFGCSPAESDVQRHFLVSAPSVHQMMQMLERRGFILRQPGVPRSIRLVEPGKCTICAGTHYLQTGERRTCVRAKMNTMLCPLAAERRKR
jgi:repressor LexA